MNARNGMKPVNPGEILRGELDELGVPVNRVTMLLNGQRGVTDARP